MSLFRTATYRVTPEATAGISTAAISLLGSVVNTCHDITLTRRY
ncbi:hypothetical protein [Streptomyces sp. RP5T]|nr:hypothetical protein [Streptomyces sp. RP5T]